MMRPAEEIHDAETLVCENIGEPMPDIAGIGLSIDSFPVIGFRIIVQRDGFC
jgi:hypothetical protein